MEKMGSNLMESLPNGVRAFLFIQVSDSLPLQELWRSGCADKGIGGDGKRVLGICSKRQRSVLVHDAEKDTQMRGIKFRSFQSALCVPILDSTRTFIGAILLLADKPETFTNEHKFAVERSARDYGPTLSGMRVVSSEAKEEEKKESVPFYASPLVMSVTAFALMLFVIWIFKPSFDSRDPLPVKTVPPPSLSHQAMDTADQFLKSLREGNYDGAWDLLSPDLKARWASADFARSLSNWAEAGANKEILEKRHISKLQRHSGSAQVLLLESSVSGDNGHWNWELRDDDGDWVVADISGPVKSP